MRVTAFVAMGIVLVANAALASAPVQAALQKQGDGPRPRGVHTVLGERLGLATSSASAIDAASPWASKLVPIEIVNRNTNAHGKVRLYDLHGVLDRGQARAFMRIAGRQHDAPDDASEDDERLDLRLVQLVVRASYHFGGATVKIISGTRPGANGRHGAGEALDFSLEGVKSPLLAAYLRGTPRAGVGIYTHPKTQYVHLDVRDHSFHWIDGSPPGVTWREQLIADPKQAARDASYSPALDLPER